MLRNAALRCLRITVSISLSDHSYDVITAGWHSGAHSHCLSHSLQQLLRISSLRKTLCSGLGEQPHRVRSSQCNKLLDRQALLLEGLLQPISREVLGG